MDLEQFLEATKKASKKKGKGEELERLKKYFERFHLINRTYMDKETFEAAGGAIPSIAEAMENTVKYLDAEIARLRSKRLKLPFENVQLADMQKVQQKNEVLLKEYLAEIPE